MKIMKLILGLTVALSLLLPSEQAKTQEKGGPNERGRKKRLKRKDGCGGRGSRCSLDVADLLDEGLDLDDIEFEFLPGHVQSFVQRGERLENFFHGEDGMYSMNLVVREFRERASADVTRILVGSVSDGENLYQISPDQFGIAQVTETPISDFPDELDPLEPSDQQDLPDEAEPLPPPNQEDVEVYPDEADPLPPPTTLGDTLGDGNFRTLEIAPEVMSNISPAVTTDPPFETRENGGRRRLFDDRGGNLDVMVVWTRESECRNANLGATCTTTRITTESMKARVDLAIAETNTAYAQSGVQTVLRLVHCYRDDSYDEPSSNTFQQAVRDLRDDGDGKMDDVHQKRVQYGADLVALLVADLSYCGVAWVGPRVDLMFSVTNYLCAVGNFSFGHELGHNMGCLHDKGTENACGNRNYNYGYRQPDARWRTILAYTCRSGQCDRNRGGGCTRIQRFSTPRRNYDGEPLGDADTDNVRQINDVRATIAGFLPVVIQCQSNSECNDSDACTVDICDTNTGQCMYTNVCSTPAPRTPNPTPAPRTPNPTPAPVAPPPANVQTLLTTTAQNNGSYGNFFNIRVLQNVEIAGFDIHTRLTSTVTVHIWTRPGPYVINNDDDGWTLWQSFSVTGEGAGTLTQLPLLHTPIRVSRGATQAFYISLSRNGIRYTNGVAEGRLFKSDGVINFYEGRGVGGYPFRGGSFVPRVWNGNIHYNTRPSSVQTLFTTSAQNNGSFGNFFNIQARQGVEIVGFDIHTRLTSTVAVHIWTRSGPYVINNNDGGWTLWQTFSVTGEGTGTLTQLPRFNTPIRVSRGATQAFYISLSRNGIRYTNGVAEGRLFKSDGVINFYEGRGVGGYPFRGGSFVPRVWNGNIYYNTLSTNIQNLLTTTSTNNGSWGNLFNIQVLQDVEIVGFDIHTRRTETLTVYVWTRSGPYVTNNNDNRWTLWQTFSVAGEGTGTLTPLPLLDNPIPVSREATQAFYISLDRSGMSYTNGVEEGRLFKTDGVINFYEGRGVRDHPFGRTFVPRVWNGNIKYTTVPRGRETRPPTDTQTKPPTQSPTKSTRTPTTPPQIFPTALPTAGGPPPTTKPKKAKKGKRRHLGATKMESPRKIRILSLQ